MPRKFQLGLGSISNDRTEGSGQVAVTTSGSVDGFPGSTKVALDELQTKRSISQPSVVAFHSTLFETFDLSSKGVYSFFTEDELENSKGDENAQLKDVPRYVALSWRASPPRPQRFNTVKDVRNGRNREPIVRSAVEIDEAVRSTSNGYISPGTLYARLASASPSRRPSLFDEDDFLSSDDTDVVLAFEGRSKEVNENIPSTLRVNFIDPSIAGAIDGSRVNSAQRQVHLGSIASLSQIMSNLETISEMNQDASMKNPPPRFPASADTPEMMYVGYLIERYTLLLDGSMTLSRVITIDDPSTIHFIDRDVVYEGRYAYRIRSIVQWTRPSNVNFFGASNVDKSPDIDLSAPQDMKVASFYGGDWSDWSEASIEDLTNPNPPDEVLISLGSDHVRIVWKMPDDPQKDVEKIHLLRSTIIDDRFSDWSVIGSFSSGNGFYVDRSIEEFETSRKSYAYSLYSTSFHGESSRLSEVWKATKRRKGGSASFLCPPGGDPSSFPSTCDREPSTTLKAVRSCSFRIRDCSSRTPLFGKSYTLELTSLSTGDKLSFPMRADSIDVLPHDE